MYYYPYYLYFINLLSFRHYHNVDYYYPYYLHFINFLSFKHYHNVDKDNEKNIKSIDNKPIVLWTISRFSYAKYKGTATFIATYNYYTKTYELNDKRYLLYDDLINDALKI
jgi:hypothetical protein